MKRCIDCGKEVSTNKTKRCKNCFIIYTQTKDYSTKCSEGQNINDFSYDTVNEISEGNYGRRLSDGFKYLSHD